MFTSLKNIILAGHADDVKTFLKVRNFLSTGGYLPILKRIVYLRKYNKISAQYGCFIPPSAEIGEGIVFPHGLQGIFISQGAKIGNNCTLFHQVTIGSNTLQDSSGFGAPNIGDNCYIGAGAKVIGNVKIGNNVRIGANAVVVDNVPDNSTVVSQKAVIIKHSSPRVNVFSEFNNN